MTSKSKGYDMLLPPHWRQVARERRSQVHKLLKIACLLDDEVCTSPGTHLNPSVCSQFSSFLLCGLSVKNFQGRGVVAYGNWYGTGIAILHQHSSSRCLVELPPLLYSSSSSFSTPLALLHFKAKPQFFVFFPRQQQQLCLQD